MEVFVWLSEVFKRSLGYSSDGQGDRTSSWIKPMILNWYSRLPCLTLNIERTVGRTSRQVYVLCRWERHLAGFPYLREVRRWLATPKRASSSALITFSGFIRGLEKYGIKFGQFPDWKRLEKNFFLVC